jgi:predicted NBD/HSP70 family sugar kinase
MAQLADSVSVTDVVRLAKEGNEQCRLALQQAGKQIGFAIANLINVIDPEQVLLGGSVIRDAWDCDFFRSPLRDCANCCVPAAKNTPIHTGMLGKYSIAYGAIVAVIDEVFRDPVLGYIPDE